MAQIEFIPLPDARREIFGADKRTKIVLDLKYEGHVIEQSFKIARGPWLLNWKGTDKSLRIDVESSDKLANLSTVVGACKSLILRCKLDPAPVVNRAELRDVAEILRHR